jgi:hypothetical protein
LREAGWRVERGRAPEAVADAVTDTLAVTDPTAV